jgi:adenosylhomocysteine nucleosidase
MERSAAPWIGSAPTGIAEAEGIVEGVNVLLFVASEPREFGGLLARGSKLPARVSLRGRDCVLIAGGPGPRLAAKAVALGLQQGNVAAMISTGFCGGLDPAFQRGDIVAALSVLDTESGEEFEANVPSGAAFCFARFASGDRVVQTASEKSALRRATGAGCVDMESAAIAFEARRAGVPFYCVRVVTDTAHDTFVNDFNAARAPDGSFSKRAVIAGALHRPFTRVPELIRFARSSSRAAKSLGDCLAACEF